MPDFLLIRHGETDFVKKGMLAGRLSGVHLNDTGRAQAKVLADTLAGTPIKSLYSSPLERTLETAEPLASALNLPIHPCEGLLETDIGDWAGEKLATLRRQKKIWKVVQHSPALMRFPGGETFAEGQMRIVNELLAIAAAHQPHDLIACVSHADPIKLAIAYFIGLPLDMFQRLVISPGSISRLQISESSSSVIGLNSIPPISIIKT